MFKRVAVYTNKGSIQWSSRTYTDINPGPWYLQERLKWVRLALPECYDVVIEEVRSAMSAPRWFNDDIYRYIRAYR